MDNARLFNLALRYLGYRARSEKEVRDYLRRKLLKVDLGASEKEKLITEIIKRLQDLNFLDDSTLAEHVLAEGRRQLKGKRRIFLDLKKKGLEIPPPVEPNPPSPSEEDLAQAAAERRAKLYQNLDPQTFRRRLASYLARRGFEWEVILPVVDRLAPKR